MCLCYNTAHAVPINHGRLQILRNYRFVVEVDFKAFNRVNRKQLKILKTILEYLEFCIVA